MIKTRILFMALVAVFLLSGSAFAAPDATFNFDGLVPGSGMPASLTNGGITAQFSSDSPTAYIVFPAFFLFASPLAGNTLYDSDSLAAHPLNILFSRTLGFVTLDFALQAPPLGGPEPALTLNAFLGSTLVGSSSAFATFSDVPSPQGTLSFGSATFDRIVLSSNQNNLAVDNIGVSVPEPTTILLLSVGLAGIGLVRRKGAFAPEN